MEIKHKELKQLAESIVNYLVASGYFEDRPHPQLGRIVLMHGTYAKRESFEQELANAIHNFQAKQIEAEMKTIRGK